MFFLLCYKIKKIDCLAFGILTILAGCGMRNVFLWWRWDAGFFSWRDAGGRFFMAGGREGGHTHIIEIQQHINEKNLDLLKWLKIRFFNKKLVYKKMGLQRPKN